MALIRHCSWMPGVGLHGPSRQKSPCKSNPRVGSIAVRIPQPPLHFSLGPPGSIIPPVLVEARRSSWDSVFGTTANPELPHQTHRDEFTGCVFVVKGRSSAIRFAWIVFYEEKRRCSCRAMTVVFLVEPQNAIDLLDGLDGLARRSGIPEFCRAYLTHRTTSPC